MTECSKPLDLVKNNIFFGAAVAVKQNPRIRPSIESETTDFLFIANEHSAHPWCEKKIILPLVPLGALELRTLSVRP